MFPAYWWAACLVPLQGVWCEYGGCLGTRVHCYVCLVLVQSVPPCTTLNTCSISARCRTFMQVLLVQIRFFPAISTSTSRDAHVYVLCVAWLGRGGERGSIAHDRASLYVRSRCYVFRLALMYQIRCFDPNSMLYTTITQIMGMVCELSAWGPSDCPATSKNFHFPWNSAKKPNVRDVR